MNLRSKKILAFISTTYFDKELYLKLIFTILGEIDSPCLLTIPDDLDEQSRTASNKLPGSLFSFRSPLSFSMASSNPWNNSLKKVMIR